MEWKKSLFFVKEATHSLCGIKHYEKNCVAKNLKGLAHGPPLWGEKKKGMKPRGKKKKKHFHLRGSARRETTRFGIY